MRNNFLSSSLNSVVSLDMDSSWAARSWDMYWNPNTNQGPFNKYKNSRSLLAEPDAVWTANLNQGKVRQLFLERRGGKGWDRSYPLEPLKNKSNINSDRSVENQRKLSPTLENNTVLSQSLPERAYFFKKLPNIGGTMQSQNAESTSAKKRISKIPQPRIGDRLKSPSATLTKDIKKLAISPQKNLGDDVSIKPKNSDLRKPATPQKNDEEKLRPLNKTSNDKNHQSSESPVLGKVRTPLNSPSKNNKINSASLNSSARTEKINSSPLSSPAKTEKTNLTALNSLAKAERKYPSPVNSAAKTERINSTSLNSAAKTERINSTSLNSAAKSERVNSTSERVKINQNSNPDMPQCSICGRSFAPDRIELHEKICKKTKTKKRKIFDPIKQRLAGTEAEPYIHKKGPQKTTTTAPPKSDWRKKHEEFIANIRAAKQVKEHLAKGGKLSDLPPPPPLDTSDYTPCPHCGRKFNQAAAERHIPKCANMKHNKPKKVNKK